MQTKNKLRRSRQRAQPYLYWLESDAVNRTMTLVLPKGENRLVLSPCLACALINQMKDQIRTWIDS